MLYRYIQTDLKRSFNETRQDGNRYAEGWWGFPDLNIKKVSWFLGFWCLDVCFLFFGVLFLGVWCLASWFKVSKIYQIPNFMFFMDIDLISKVFQILFNGSSSLFGAHLLGHCHFFICKNEIYEHIILRATPSAAGPLKLSVGTDPKSAALVPLQRGAGGFRMVVKLIHFVFFCISWRFTKPTSLGTWQTLGARE